MSSFYPVAFKFLVELVCSILRVFRLTALLVESTASSWFASETLLITSVSFLSISLASFLSQNELLLSTLVLALIATLSETFD